MTRPLRCAELIPASEAAVLGAIGRPEVWIRAMRAAGYRCGGNPPVDFASPVELTFTADSRMLLPRTMRLLAGPDGHRLTVGGRPLTDLSMRTAATAAGTLVTLELSVHAGGTSMSVFRRRLLRWGELLLGIVAVTARDLTVVVAAAVTNGDRVLVARRAAPPEHRGRWELPGGKVQPGEAEAAALRRELMEELGVEVAVDGPIGPVVELSKTAVLRAFGCRLTAGDPSPVGEPADHDQVRWLPASTLDSVDWLTADRELLPALRAHLRALTAQM